MKSWRVCVCVVQMGLKLVGVGVLLAWCSGRLPSGSLHPPFSFSLSQLSLLRSHGSRGKG